MNPAWWIGILAMVGAALGFALQIWVGWGEAIIGAVIGMLVGALVYRLRAEADGRE